MSRCALQIHESDAAREILRGFCHSENTNSRKYDGVPNRDQRSILHDAVVDANAAATGAFDLRSCSKDIGHIECAEHFHCHNDATPVAYSPRASESESCAASGQSGKTLNRRAVNFFASVKPPVVHLRSYSSEELA